MRSRMTYANVMATIAVFVALGGTGYAVTQLPKNSVKAKHIASGAVGAEEIKKAAVESNEIANGSVKPADLKAGTVAPGFAVTSNTADPPASPDISYLGPGPVFATPASGKLLVRMDAFANPVGEPGGMLAECDSGNPEIGLYLVSDASLNEQAIPNTGMTLQNNTWTDLVVTGVTADEVPAGDWQISIGVNCPDGNPQTWNNSSTATITVELID